MERLSRDRLSNIPHSLYTEHWTQFFWLSSVADRKVIHIKIKSKLRGRDGSNSSWNALHEVFYEPWIFKVIVHNAFLSLSTSTKASETGNSNTIFLRMVKEEKHLGKLKQEMKNSKTISKSVVFIWPDCKTDCQPAKCIIYGLNLFCYQ